MPRRRRIRVKYSKLGRANAWGLAHTDSYVVELDERLKGKKHLEILLHEVVHALNKPQRPVIGKPVPPEEIAKWSGNPRGYLAWLRELTLALKDK